MALPTSRITLVETAYISPTVKHFKFSMPTDRPFNFIPGQFITLHIPSGEKILKRSYSIASIPDKDKTIDFAASYVAQGVASEFLFNLKIGASIEMIGPLGRLILRDEPVKRYVLIATGTGVTPYRAMLPSLAQRIRDQQLKVVIMEGVKGPENLLYKDDFLEYAKEFPEHLSFGAYYSVKDPALSYEHKGYVSHHLSSLTLNPSEDIVYLCGNPNMIDEVYEQLKALDFNPSHVRREKYFSGAAVN